MLSLFRNKLIINIIWVVLFAFAIQALHLAFINSAQAAAIYTTSPLLSFWLSAFNTGANTFYISLGIAFVLSLAVGFIYNIIINANEVLFRQSFFPALFFFYLTHLAGIQNVLSPQLLVAVLSMLLVYKYLSLDPRNIKTTPFLDMGFFASLSFCILPEAIFFIPALLIALIIAGYLTFKNFLLLLTGISIPIYFLGVAFFLMEDTWSAYWSFFNFDFLMFDSARFTVLTWVDYTVLGYIGFVLLVSLLNLQPNFSKNTIRTRRALQLLLLFLVSGLAAVAFSKAPLYQSLILLALPLSTFLSYYFLKTKRAFWRETLFALFFFILIIAEIATSN